MANEAVPVEGPYEVHDFTVANATAIVQYSLMKLSDPRTAALGTANGDIFAGIAMSEKAASDGAVNMGMCTKGIFKLTAGTTTEIPAGTIVSFCGENIIKIATEAEIAAGKAIGKAMETIASGTTGEVIVGY